MPAPEHVRVKAFSHLLGESDTSFFAPPARASRLRRTFPASLKDAPALLPAPNTALRRGIDEWCAKQDLRLRVIGEFDDTALMKLFCQATPAVFPAPAAIEQDICRFYGVRVVGRTSGVKERYYAISVERRLKHPGVIAITTTAREDVLR